MARQHIRKLGSTQYRLTRSARLVLLVLLTQKPNLTRQFIADTTGVNAWRTLNILLQLRALEWAKEVRNHYPFASCSPHAWSYSLTRKGRAYAELTLGLDARTLHDDELL